MTDTTTEQERLLRIYRSAEVYAPEINPHPIRRARAFVTNQRVVVWAERDDGAVGKVIDEAITGGELPEPDRGTQHGGTHVETASGPIHVTRGGGCGCGSALSAIDPPAPW